jgi:hypothetical protein
MFKYGILLLLSIMGAFAPGYSIAPLKVKTAKKQVKISSTLKSVR